MAPQTLDRLAALLPSLVRFCHAESLPFVARGSGTSLGAGNIGCLVQLAAHLARQGSAIRVRHTMQVLRDAYHRPE